MQGAWRKLERGQVDTVRGQLGVYQLADGDDVVTLIGYAGGRSLFGLRGELDAHLARGETGSFRIEATSAYLSRYRELLMVHLADNGILPPRNTEDPARIGHLSPG